MKQNLLILFILIYNLSDAQITVNRGDLIVSGQKAVQASDSSAHAFASGGSNQNWDFSDLKTHELDTLRFGMPFWYPGYENFPTANLAYVGSLVPNSISYLKADNSGLSVVGIYTYSDTDVFILPIKSKIINFPATYNSNYNESNKSTVAAFEFGIDPDSTGPIPFIDSIRVNLTVKDISNVDGWGNMKTPLGTFATIKQTRLQITSQSFDMKTSGFWLTIPSNILSSLGFPASKPDSSYSVNFWTNDASVGFPLVSYDYGPGDTMASNSTWLQTKPSASSLEQNQFSAISIYPNPVNSELRFVNTAPNARIEILNSEGKRILNTILDATQTVNLEFLTRGLYCISIYDSENGVLLYTDKLIKE